MKKLSNLMESNALVTPKEQVINFACSSTGLTKEVVTKIYESQKNNLIPDEEIINYFNDLVKPKETVKAFDLLNVFASISTEIDVDKKELMVDKFIECLKDVSNQRNEVSLDSINLMTLLKDIALSIKPDAKDKLNNVISLKTNQDNLKQLNESFQLVNTNIEDSKMVLLLESMSDILYKNNRRWGVNNALDNSYNSLMDYISETIEELQLNSEIYATDKMDHLNLINQFLSGNINPIYKNFSSAKTQIRDVQTLILDLVLINSNFVFSRKEDLQFISRNTYNRFQKSLSDLIPNLYSSIKISKVLNDEFVKNVFLNNKQVIGKDAPFGNGDFATQIVCNVDLSKLEYINQNISNSSIKGMLEIIDFIDSSTFDFNLKIRPLLRNYVNASRELVRKIESARIMNSKYNGNIN